MTAGAPEPRWAIAVPDAAPCGVCGEPARLVSLAFEAPMCGVGCEDEAWREYTEAERLAAAPQPVGMVWDRQRRGWRFIYDVVHDLAEWPRVTQTVDQEPPVTRP